MGWAFAWPPLLSAGGNGFRGPRTGASAPIAAATGSAWASAGAWGPISTAGARALHHELDRPGPDADLRLLRHHERRRESLPLPVPALPVPLLQGLPPPHPAERRGRRAPRPPLELRLLGPLGRIPRGPPGRRAPGRAGQHRPPPGHGRASPDPGPAGLDAYLHDGQEAGLGLPREGRMDPVRVLLRPEVRRRELGVVLATIRASKYDGRAGLQVRRGTRGKEEARTVDFSRRDADAPEGLFQSSIRRRLARRAADRLRRHG